MPDLHFTILIQGSPETIFALIADLAHYDRWLPGSSSFGAITEISPLPVALGTTYIDAGPSGVRRGVVTEYDPPTLISFHQPMQVKQGLISGAIDIHLRHTLEPQGQSTRLDRDLTLGIQGLLKLAQPVIIAQFRRENERMLLALKRYVEKAA
jgi:carbon monoxide dehydrogenase subunit G